MHAALVANVLARALVPVVGVVFLGWSGPRLLVVYFADTLASIYALMVLVLQAEALRAPAAGDVARTGLGSALTPIPFLLVIAGFFGVLPLFVMLDLQDVRWGEFLLDREMWIGVACQFATALFLLLRQLDEIRSLENPRRHFKIRFALLAARWGALVLVGFFLARFIPRVVYGPLLIVVYALATAALELAPARVLEAIGRIAGRDDLALLARDMRDRRVGRSRERANPAKRP